MIDDPGFQINPIWLGLQFLAFLLFIVIVVWVVRYVIRSRRK